MHRVICTLFEIKWANLNGQNKIRINFECNKKNGSSNTLHGVIYTNSMKKREKKNTQQKYARKQRERKRECKFKMLSITASPASPFGTHLVGAQNGKKKFNYFHSRRSDKMGNRLDVDRNVNANMDCPALAPLRPHKNAHFAPNQHKNNCLLECKRK